MTIGKAAIIFAHAAVGWALCGATIGIGMATTTMENTLIIHAILAPIIFGMIAWNYFVRFHYTSAWETAALFTGIVILLDFFVVALIIYGSLDMFRSVLGTWIPFGSILAATYVTGLVVSRRGSHTGAPAAAKL